MKLNFFLYIGMAVTSAVQGVIGTDEAAKYLQPESLFWIRSSTVVLDAAFLAAKTFTSGTFKDWVVRRQAKAAAKAIDAAAK